MIFLEITVTFYKIYRKCNLDLSYMSTVRKPSEILLKIGW